MHESRGVNDRGSNREWNTYLRNTKETSGVAKAPVAKFVRQDGNHLLSVALLDQGVIDDDMLLPRKTKEVGIAVCAALATIDDIELVERLSLIHI